MENDKPVVKNEPLKSGSVAAGDLSRIVAEAVAEALKAAIPAAAVGINEAQRQANDRISNAKVQLAVRKFARCALCGQPKTACGGEWKMGPDGIEIKKFDASGAPLYDVDENHIRAYVGPNDHSLWKHYDGQRVNGVVYKSPAPGVGILIPKKSDILTDVNRWERNEKEQAQGRNGMGMGAGYVGPTGQVVAGSPAAIGWR